MSPEKSAYVFNYYSHLMTLTEKAAFRNFFLIEKNQVYKSRNLEKSDSQFYNKKYVKLSSVLALMEGGFEAFRDRDCAKNFSRNTLTKFFSIIVLNVTSW